MTDDIVARLRVWSIWLDERIPDTEIGNDLREAADEIERLRKERDEARRRYCFAMAEHGEEAEARQTAKEEGWDCYRGASDADR